MLAIRRPLDLVLEFLALVILSPLLGLIALLVRVKLGLPTLFRQQRPGLHGRPFTIYKFRTMTNVCDAQGNLLPDAQRLTPFDRFLRRTRRANGELFNAPKHDKIGPLQACGGA